MKPTKPVVDVDGVADASITTLGDGLEDADSRTTTMLEG